MPDSLQPILPYPSRQSLIDLVLATIELSSSADLRDDWDDNEPLYLQESDIASSDIFREVLDGVISGAEPAPWLLRDLKEFEQMLVEYVIEGLEDTSEGSHFLNVMRANVNWRSWAQQQQEQISDDAQ